MKIDTQLNPDQVCTQALIGENIEAHISSHISAVAEEWEQLIPNDIFFSVDFLQALEDSPPSGTFYRYVIFKSEGQNVGFAYFQIKLIQLAKSLKIIKGHEKGFDKIFSKLKYAFAKKLKSHVIVCGNMTLTGNYGYRFIEGIDKDRQFEIIEKTSSIIENQLNKDGKHAAAVMLKDFYLEEVKPTEKDFSYTRFSVQPNMIMHLDPEWKSFEDYILAMRSKYRVRVRRALKKCDPVEKRILSLDEVISHQDDIARLYRHVAEQANFNLFILPKDYFQTLSSSLDNNMRVTGYFIDNKMVGFFTSIKNVESLDAHFLGYDPEFNGECQLYLNMLYDLLSEGIDKRCKHVDMSRTAMEIKSSVGALPVDMYIYLKLTSNWKNKFVPWLLNYMKPVEDWVPRNPFKN